VVQADEREGRPCSARLLIGPHGHGVFFSPGELRTKLSTAESMAGTSGSGRGEENRGHVFIDCACQLQ
jgi:hypothetical protein